MELQLTKIKEPLQVVNYEEVEKWVKDLIKPYTNYVVTEDLIKTAKDDVAQLNKIKKTLNDEKIRVKKEIIDRFESQVKDLITIIDDGTKTIKTQLDVFEEERLNKKKEEINNLYSTLENLNEIPLDKIYNKKWENKGSTLKAIEKEMTESLNKINNDIAILKDYAETDSELVRIKMSYLGDLDVNKAITEFKEYKQQLLELRNKQNSVVEQQKDNSNVITPNTTETSVEMAKTSIKRYAVGLEFKGTLEQMQLLNKLLKEKGIDYFTLYKKEI